MTAPDLAALADLSARIILFPVCHHSPTAARLVGHAIERLRPEAVLIESPSDFNDRLDELLLPHQLPIAIYSYVRTADGSRLGAFYPLCEHSPEWQALQLGHQYGAQVRFIDLPWADIAAADQQPPSNRFNEAIFLRSQYIHRLCQRLGVSDFSSLWDTLFEIDDRLQLEDYLRRCHELCGRMRLLEAPGLYGDRVREAFMARQIQQMSEATTGKILVVVGGGHALALYARLNGLDLGEMLEPAEATLVPIEDGEERGLALTPYSFERLDNLTGYDAGMPNPGFYHQIWQDRRAGRSDTHRTLLGRIVEQLRRFKQPISSADLIAAESTAQALANLRGHRCVWRTDLVDGLTTALVKEELTRTGRHPLLEAIHDVLRGGQRGRLAEGVMRPPLVQDIQARLAEHQLEPRPVPREIELVLEVEADRPASQVLHRLRLLAIAGFDRCAGTNLATREEMVSIWERWRIGWSPDFEARCIEAARYGPTLADATAAALAERIAEIGRSAARAAELLLDAGLAGLIDLAWALRQRVGDLIRGESDYFGLTEALGHLLYLYRYDTVLRTAGSEPMGDLLRDAYARALWLLEGLGQTSGRDRELIQGVIALRETFERCEVLLGLARDELTGVLRRVAADRAQTAVLRGAALGACWSLNASDADAVRNQLRQFLDPDQLGDFLSGLFALAREQVPRQRDLLLAIHEVLLGWPEEDFLRALPALRLAFTYFTPREKHHLALRLREALGLDPQQEMAALQVDVPTALRALALEGQLLAAVAKYGLRQML